jgi:hypothetical protein
MRYLFVTPQGVIDTLTGELSQRPTIEQLMRERPGGVIAGRNLYPLLAPLMQDMRRDVGWTAAIVTQKKRQDKDRVGGVIYFSHLYYRHAKIRSNGVRYRPASIKWLVLNLELFCETTDIEDAARALVELAERRGIRPRYSPGSFGGAMLRASKEWEKGRHAAPRFISEIAREHLPGNYYQLRSGYRSTPRAYYLDQQSSHHTIAATCALCHPHFVHARGRLRAVEREKYPPWIKTERLDILSEHIGLLQATVECDRIPHQLLHLYPPWARNYGTQQVWIWTPELRLLDRRVRLRWVSAGLTCVRSDPALREYANWALDVLSRDKRPAIKPALLAAYGMLGVRTTTEIERYSVHGRKKPPRAEVCRLPLIDGVYRSTIQTKRTPVIQNVVARGLIEAETRTRSIELARQLETEGFPVVQIYADGLLTTAEQLPFLPSGWRIAGELTHVSAPHANSILSDEIVRLPGIPNGRRTQKIVSRTLDKTSRVL